MPAAKLGLAEQFTPKLVTVLREGYRAPHLAADALAGLTVAIVALPLSIAIAVASGAGPAQGLTSAIIGGFLASALGGSRFQIGGPAGAFIVLVQAAIAAHGMAITLAAVFMSGVLLAGLGLLRLGVFVKFIPYPVTLGFTAGIGAIILSSQLKELFGLQLGGPEAGPILEKLPQLAAAAETVNLSAFGIGAGVAGAIWALRALRPHWPGILIAIVVAAGLTAALELPIDTIADRFGELPRGLPAPHLPMISVADLATIAPIAISFALLGAIESLLSAVVADGMTGRRHRSNSELLAQGIANLATACFGGICVTGTIARTATNVRAGAHGPVAGMMHAGFLLVFLTVAGPLIGYIPLAALAGVLIVVAVNMIEAQAMWRLARADRADAVVLAATFGLTLFRDLTEAILVGFALGALGFIYRMAQTAAVKSGGAMDEEDAADSALPDRAGYDSKANLREDVLIYRVSGAFFFGAAAAIGAVLDRIGDHHRVLIVDFAAAPLIDSSGAQVIEAWIGKAARRGIAVYVTGLSAETERRLRAFGVFDAHARLLTDIDGALADWRGRNGP